MLPSQICLYTEGVPSQLIADQKVPFAVPEHQWVGFDDKTSLTTKVFNNFFFKFSEIKMLSK